MDLAARSIGQLPLALLHRMREQGSQQFSRLLVAGTRNHDPFHDDNTMLVSLLRTLPQIVWPSGSIRRS
jgi:hypothetical protein